MADYNVATYNPSTGKLGVPQGVDRYNLPKAVHFEGAMTTDGTVDGRDLAADGTKLDLLTYTGGINLDTRVIQIDALQTQQDFLTVTQAVDLDAMEVKTNWISVSQAVNLDTIEARVNALDAAVVLMGSWDAAVPGTFPVSTVAGESWIVSVAGTVAAVSPMIMNWFIGTITSGGSYTPAFIAITVSVILGVLSIFVLIKAIEPVRKTIE